MLNNSPEEELKELERLVNHLQALRTRLENWFQEQKACPRCRGLGVIEVPNGPDDYEKVFCLCEYGISMQPEERKE